MDHLQRQRIERVLPVPSEHHGFQPAAGAVKSGRAAAGAGQVRGEERGNGNWAVGSGGFR